MKPSPDKHAATALRRAAEARLEAKPALHRLQSEVELQKLQHELEVHQIELEMQNEELRAGCAELEAGERYTNLYDFAPVGYFTLTPEGKIHQVNLTGAKLIGVERARLVGQRLQSLIAEPDRPAFALFLRQSFATGLQQNCEVLLLESAGRPLFVGLLAIRSPAGNECRLVMLDITERKRAEESLRLSQHQLNEAQRLAQLGSWQLVFGAEPARWTGSAELHRIYGYPPDQMLTLETGFDRMHPDDRERIQKTWAAFLRGEIPGEWEHRIVVEGRIKWLQVAAQAHFDPTGRLSRVTGTNMDITAHKQAEIYDAMDREVLQILNEPGNLKVAVQRVLAIMQLRTGFDALGLRLQHGDDFPYFVQAGFSEEFLRTENSLVQRTAEGGSCRDQAGKPALECTCGLVLSGRIDPANPLFTWGGSCWTNDSAKLLHLPPGADPRLHPRNQCIHHGYQSVALVPIRTHDRILGLIQFNDRHPDAFTLKTVESLEEIAAHIGLALMRKQAEAALVEKQQLLIETERMGHVGGWEFDIATGKQTWTQAVYDIHEVPYDYQPTVELGINFYTPASRPVIARAVQRAIELGETFDVELEIITAKGNLRQVHAIGHADLARGRVFGFFQDISERKQAQQALANERVLLRNLVDNLPVAVYLKDTAGRKTLANPVDLQNMGLTSEAELLGKTDYDLFPPEQAAAFHADDELVLQTGQPVLNREEQLTRADGSIRCLLTSKVPIFDNSGAVTGLVGIGLDITERKRAEEQMNLQISALAAAANAIVVTNRDGKIEWVNPAFTKLTGYSAEEAIGGNPRMLKSGEHPPAFYGTLWATVLTGNVWHGELVNKRKDGRLYTEEMTITPVQGADGQIAHFVAIKQDITERRQLEKRMLQAQKMEAIGQLAGGIAHDFNNMLAALFGYAHLLQQDTVGNPLAQESVTEILVAANRAKELVQQILSFSRQREQRPQIIKLDTIVKEALKFLRASLPAHIKIEKELAAETPAVLADPTQIYQVTMNLATNALHAMGEAPGRLLIRLDPVQPDEKLIQTHPELKPILYARLTVADTGQGMDAKTLERIFEPFFTTKPVGKGTGLGLAVVHGIVEAHNGLITVDSQVGQGTTFTLYFPAQAQAATLSATDISSVPHGHGQKILAVDDEPALTSVLQKMLHRLDYQVTTSNQAAEAIRLLREQPEQFDLVITDLTMPEMSGLEVAKQIRAIRPGLPVILVSGYSVSVDAERLREAGICERLDKPVSPGLLAEVLARVLKKV